MFVGVFGLDGKFARICGWLVHDRLYITVGFLSLQKKGWFGGSHHNIICPGVVFVCFCWLFHQKFFMGPNPVPDPVDRSDEASFRYWGWTGSIQWVLLEISWNSGRWRILRRHHYQLLDVFNLMLWEGKNFEGPNSRQLNLAYFWGNTAGIIVTYSLRDLFKRRNICKLCTDRH